MRHIRCSGCQRLFLFWVSSDISYGKIRSSYAWEIQKRQMQARKRMTKNCWWIQVSNVWARLSANDLSRCCSKNRTECKFVKLDLGKHLCSVIHIMRSQLMPSSHQLKALFRSSRANAEETNQTPKCDLWTIISVGLD